MYAQYYSIDRVRGLAEKYLWHLQQTLRPGNGDLMYNMENGIPPEYLQASATDDVECFSVYLETLFCMYTNIIFPYRPTCLLLKDYNHSVLHLHAEASAHPECTSKAFIELATQCAGQTSLITCMPPVVSN